MALIYRKEKGDSLTIDEMDCNFKHLFDMISALDVQIREIISRSNELDDIRAVGLRIQSDGVVLDVPNMKYKGLFDASVAYQPGEFVWKDGSFFIAIDVVSSGPWDASKWKCIIKFA